MSLTVDDAFRKYFRRFQDELPKREAEGGPDRLRLLLSEDELLERAVARAEATPEFSDLLAAGEEEFPDAARWCTKTFFRLSGVYESWFNCAQLALDETVGEYRRALGTKERKITYLALLEFVEFDQDILDCGDFQIRCFSRGELDEKLRNGARRIFYKEAYVDVRSAMLDEYWFLVLEETTFSPDPNPWNEIIGFDNRVRLSYSPHRGPLESALRRLALFDWDSNPFGERVKGRPPQYDQWDGPFRLEIPFVIMCSDTLIEEPTRCPDFSKLHTEPRFDHVTGEELGERPQRYPGVMESKPVEAFMKHVYALLKRLEGRDRHWRFVDTALGFLLKGFLTEGMEQLLWNVTTVDAVLGEKGRGLTKLLKTRVAAILGRTEGEREGIRARFEDLYEFRSELVHGNAELSQKEVYLGHLSEAREFARSAVLWMISYLSHVADNQPPGSKSTPSREELLKVLDMNLAASKNLVDIRQTVPPQFPCVEEWLNPCARVE